jgi:hypothetical protein
VTETITNHRRSTTPMRSNHIVPPPGSANSGVQNTSLVAAQSLDPKKEARRGQKILHHIQTNAGATCYEVERELGVLHQSASAAIRQLCKAGRLVDSGERRRTNTGRMAIVWRVAR